MNRRGLWAAGVVLILLVVGAGVLTVGTGYAQNENAAGAKCSNATLEGTYLFAQNGVEIKGNEQLLIAATVANLTLAATKTGLMRDLNHPKTIISTHVHAMLASQIAICALFTARFTSRILTFRPHF